MSSISLSNVVVPAQGLTFSGGGLITPIKYQGQQSSDITLEFKAGDVVAPWVGAVANSNYAGGNSSSGATRFTIKLIQQTA